MPELRLNLTVSFMAMSDELTVTYDPLIELMAKFENVRAVDTSVDPFEGLSVEDRLKKHIIDGIKKNLERDIEAALETYKPLDIINDILLDGMKTVGELFGAGKMQLPFVLQSAEVMKASVRQLEPLMEKEEGSDKGSILLATVSGDVHDIGKNLVDIILSNNGYRVVNIGIKQPINNILDKAAEHQCQVIGLSGLLVKSTLIMKDNLLEMNERGLEGYPVILGGAALTRGYVEQDLRSLYKGSVFYAQDAFEGLSLMGRLCSDDPEPAVTSGLVVENTESDSPYERVASHRVGVIDEELYKFTGMKSDVTPVDEPPPLPFYGERRQSKFDIFEIYKYINPVSLFRGQWQFKRPEGMGNVEFNEWLEAEAGGVFDRMKRELASLMKPRVKWGYFPCASEGNDLIIFQEDAKTERTRFTFPRQRDGRRQCLSDFFKPLGEGVDTVGFSIVTIGSDVTAHERKLFADGEFQDYLFTHGMGVETAEALAEYWHRQMRIELGIAADDSSEMKLLFSGKYRGSRYSFGYPACPNLEDQTKLFELLKPEDIGVQLTEEFMLDPEQSTSAIVVHHPDAKYFNVR